MELSNSFEVGCEIEQAWAVLTDVARIAPCLPGAQLTETTGDEYHGIVKVKVGPITAQYKGKAEFSERDDAGYRAVISATGRDTRGAGNASAAITAHLESVDETTTRVNVHTDLTITGKVAQFGRGVMADVSRKLMAQFADNLAALIAADSAADDTATDGSTAAGTATDGSTAAGTATDGSTAAGTATDGSTAAGTATDGSTAAGTATDGSTAAGIATDGSNGAGTTTDASDAATGGTADAGGAGAAEAPPAPVSSRPDAGADEVEAVDLLAVAGAPVLKRLLPVVVVLAVVVVVIIVAVA